jgi:hypothetical protein
MIWGAAPWGRVPWGGRFALVVVEQPAGIAFLTGSAIIFSGGNLVGSGTSEVGLLTGNIIHFYQGLLAQTSDFQWTQGTVDLTQGSPIVAGLGTGWIGQISPADLLLAQVDEPSAGLLYEVLSVQTDEQLTLRAPWQGLTLRAAPYLIHRRHGSLPRLSGDDQGLAQIITYTMIRIDAALQGFSEVLPPADVWILDAGIWNDTGIWVDTETWSDS